MQPSGMFSHLPPAYFTVTVRQQTIDQWKRHGGRTTFSARSTKTEDSNRLVPSISVVDCLTGQPAHASRNTVDGGRLVPSGIPLLEQDTSNWRLPVLVFCGKDDIGLSVEDEAYLGNPMLVPGHLSLAYLFIVSTPTASANVRDRNQACVIFSEQWIVESINAGGLRFLADYAKHAPNTLNVDDPSLYLPCPFPPTYHPATSPYANDPFIIEPEADHQSSNGKARCSIRSFHVLGPYEPSKSSPSLPTGSQDDDKRLVRHELQGSCQQQQPSSTFALRADEGPHKSVVSTAQHLKSEPSSTLSPHSRTNDFEQHSATPGQEDPQSLDNVSVRRQDNAGSLCERTQQLEDYILGKIRKHLSMLQHQAALWHQEMKEAEERREEELVEVELRDSGRSQSGMGQRGTSECPSVQRNGNCEGSLQTIPKAASRLQLEADTLLQLLPPLRRSSQLHPRNGKGREEGLYAKHGSIPASYPYLTPPTSAPNTEGATLTPRGLVIDQQDQVLAENHPLPEILSPRRQSLHTRRMIAFHTPGHGVGWLDFEACDDWVIVQKRRRVC